MSGNQKKAKLELLQNSLIPNKMEFTLKFESKNIKKAIVNLCLCRYTTVHNKALHS